jgi:hypothetical protein
MVQCNIEREVTAVSEEEINVESDVIRSYTDTEESQMVDLTSPVKSPSVTTSSSIASLLPSVVQSEEAECSASSQENIVPVMWSFDPIDTLKKYRTNKQLNDSHPPDTPILQIHSESASSDSPVTDHSDESGVFVVADGIELGTKEAEIRLCRVLAKNVMSHIQCLLSLLRIHSSRFHTSYPHHFCTLRTGFF